MYVKINTGRNVHNRGSCSDLINYLSKESRSDFKDKNGNSLDELTALKTIDEHSKGMHSKSQKFYMLSVNPSHNEVLHLVNQYREEHGIDQINRKTPKEQLSFNRLSSGEQRHVIDCLENKFLPKVMDSYAKGFHTPGLDNHQQLVYVSKMEFTRNYDHTDKAVKDGLKQKGAEKEGFNVHIHVVVARRDADKTYIMSPGKRPYAKQQAIIAEKESILKKKETELKAKEELFKQGKLTAEETKTYLSEKNELWEEKKALEAEKKRGTTGGLSFELMEFKTNCIAQFKDTFNYQWQDRFYKQNKHRINIGSKIENKLKQNLINHTTQGSFIIEKKLINNTKQVISTASTVAKLATNPTSAAKDMLKQAIKKILDNTLEKDF